jgi:hypothetical protein
MQTTSDKDNAKLADDLLVGGRAIADETGLTLTQIYYWPRPENCRSAS